MFIYDIKIKFRISNQSLLGKWVLKWVQLFINLQIQI